MVNQLRYSREELFSLKNVKPSTHTRLPDPLHHCLLDNGIARKPRGCRGGDGDRTKHAGVVVSNRHSNVKQAFNYNGRFRAPTLIHILLFRSTFQLLSHKPMTTGTFEFINVTIALPTNESQHSTTCRIPPRPPSSSLPRAFLDDFTQLLNNVANTLNETIICGDFNIKYNNTESADVANFADLLDCAGFIQHVTDATHLSGDLLDLIITHRS